MAKIKNISGEDRTVPWLGGRLVADGQVVEVDAEQVTAFTQQEGTWAPADKDAQKQHDAMLKGIAELAGDATDDPTPAEAPASDAAPENEEK